jgi:hypothetical protein
MKPALTIVFILLTSVLFSQATPRDVVISFWNSNVKAIIDLDKQTIIDQTNFPLEGSWGYNLDLNKAPEEWTKDDYTSNLEKIFNQETRDQLKQKSYNDLVHYKNEQGELIYIVNVVFTTKMEGSSDMMESSTIFFFKMFDSKWKLYSIEYAG